MPFFLPFGFFLEDYSDRDRNIPHTSTLTVIVCAGLRGETFAAVWRPCCLLPYTKIVGVSLRPGSVSGFFTGNATRDHAIADFLLGYFSGASVFQPAGFGVEGKIGNPRQFNFSYLGPYIQDDWKVNQRLTLNLGLRYDFRTIPTESNDRMGWRDLSNPRGGLLVADQNLVETGIVGDQSYYKFAGRRNPAEDSKRVFAPRFGFAFRPLGHGIVQELRHYGGS